MQNRSDLKHASKTLHKKKLTLAIVKDGVTIFETHLRGISGFLKAIDETGSNLEGASVADRVVGKAIALLCVYAKVEAVYALTLSERAKGVFEEKGIHC